MPWVIVRTYSAGVFFGHILERKGKEVRLSSARRLWFWSGAASLSELAIYGVKDPNNCKFAVPVSILLTEAIEVIHVTYAAKKSIDSVTEWRA